MVRMCFVVNLKFISLIQQLLLPFCLKVIAFRWFRSSWQSYRSSRFKHLFTRYYPQNIHFSYWHGKEKHEVDLVGEVNNEVIPFEVKYRSTSTNIRQLKGLLELCQKNLLVELTLSASHLMTLACLTVQSFLMCASCEFQRLYFVTGWEKWNYLRLVLQINL